MVITESRESSPSTVAVTCVCAPACSVPEVAEKFSSPTRLTGSEIDHDTGPPTAVMVMAVPPRVLRTTEAGATVSVPGATVAGVETVGAGDLDGEGAAGVVAAAVAAGVVADELGLVAFAVLVADAAGEEAVASAL
jgi:hypothetical protein